MEKEVIPLQFEGSNVRFFDLKGELWAVGKDVCLALGYKDPTTAIRSHCRGVQKQHPIIDSLGRPQEVRIINEADIFRLILKSTLPAAQEFERRVMEEILPQIRRTGSYNAIPAQAASRYPFFDRSDCAAVLSELRQCCAVGLLSRDSFNNIVLGTVPATVLRQVPRSSSLDQFIQVNLLFVSGSYEKASDVHARYLLCGGVADMTKCRLTRYLRTNYPDVAVKQKKLNGYPVQVYWNVSMTPEPVKIEQARPRSVPAIKQRN